MQGHNKPTFQDSVFDGRSIQRNMMRLTALIGASWIAFSAAQVLKSALTTLSGV